MKFSAVYGEEADGEESAPATIPVGAGETGVP